MASRMTSRMASRTALSALGRPVCSRAARAAQPAAHAASLKAPARFYQSAPSSAKALAPDALAQANPLRQAFARLRANSGVASTNTADERRRQASLGMWQMLPGANVSRALARTPGIDWVLVDCEHGAIDDAQMHTAVPVIAAEGASPIVRIPDFQPWMVKRALDSGAHGILAPLIRTVDEVKAFVSACKFPPEGTRGFGSPLAMQGFRVGSDNHPVALPTFTEYLDQANASVVTMVQIETREALENVEAIAPLVDGLFVGPFDLANNLGHPIRDGVFPAEVKTAMQRVLAAANAVDTCCCGVYAGTPEQARDYAAQGFHMMNVVTDVLTLQAAAAAAVQTVRL